MNTSAVARCIRTNARDITDAWKLAFAAERPERVGPESDPARYLPEFLDCLADCADANRGDESSAFLEVARQHAVDRLRSGSTLEELRLEYALLRKVVLEQLQTHEPSASPLEGLIGLNEALDHATELAVRCYDERRSSQGESFVRLLGHDLRNPLNAACIATDALTRSESLSDRGQKRLSTIARANARMSRLIENMLDFARSYFGGELPLMVEDGDWGEVCQTAFDEVRAENPSRALTLTQHGNLYGSFDRERLRQAVSNVLNNALEHGKDPIQLAVFEDERDDGDCIVTRVTSHGNTVLSGSVQSLDPLAEPKIASGSNARMGLYVTTLIARAHGAACQVVSDADEMSFSVRWPRAAPV